LPAINKLKSEKGAPLMKPGATFSQWKKMVKMFFTPLLEFGQQHLMHAKYMLNAGSCLKKMEGKLNAEE
jgi:hypothetical protein